MAGRTRRLVLALALVLLGWAAIASTHSLGSYGTSGDPVIQMGQPDPFQVTPQPSQEMQQLPRPLPPHEGTNGPLRYILLVLALVAAWYLVRLLRRLRWEREQASEAEVSQAEPVRVDLDELADELGRTREHLATTADLHGAVVECWRRLEDLAAASGAARQPWQSTSEYSVDVLQHTPAERSDLVELADTYRAACYSSTPATEADRQRALACIDRLSAALEAR